MENHVQIFLNKLSYASITVATLTFFFLYLQMPETCVDPSDPNPKPHTWFPTSTCDFNPRYHASLDKRNRRIWSTKSWTSAVSSYAAFFKTLHISNHSRALIVSAGPGHAVVAMNELGVGDVTGVELVDSPPLVSRADPHNLPFFDGIFDVGFGVYLDRALFPGRYVREVEKVLRLFKKSRFVRTKNVTLAGEFRTGIIMEVER